MGLYVEVTCDERKEWPKTADYVGKLNNRCVSDRSDNPQGRTVAEARREAKQQGWFIKGSYACCPDCRATLSSDGAR